jgi:hypothetical protein
VAIVVAIVSVILILLTVTAIIMMMSTVSFQIDPLVAMEVVWPTSALIYANPARGR